MKEAWRMMVFLALFLFTISGSCAIGYDQGWKAAQDAARKVTR